MKDTSVIPSGMYCYTVGLGKGHKRCPYWSHNPDKPTQMNGYCSFLGKGDWDEDMFGLLWDLVKECDENPGGDWE